MPVASPVDAERTLTAFAWKTLTRRGCPSRSWVLSQPYEDFFMSQSSEKLQLYSVFVCFDGPRGQPRTGRYWRLAWRARGRGGGIFSTTYNPSGPHTLLSPAPAACCEREPFKLSTACAKSYHSVSHAQRHARSHVRMGACSSTRPSLQQLRISCLGSIDCSTNNQTCVFRFHLGTLAS